MTSTLGHLDTLNIDNILKLTESKKAILFDMDGTILNSECLHFEAIHLITQKQSPYTIDDLYGLADTDVYPLISKYMSHDLDNFLKAKNDLMLDLIPATDPNTIIKPEMQKLLKLLNESGKTLAVVTASEDVITHSLLDHCGVSKYFKLVVTRQDTVLSKPHPAPYQYALKVLKIDKKNSLIFEDSPTGLQAAKASGIDTFQVSWYEHK
ncbi:HAD family phosphatase [Bacteriovorax sp. Seq25_V]|uniref:HAD family hydrolase n=1 Tax=Bacteriovorax sp. Seq25_V TaxID=1201288 RepID=UPI00038A4E3C|nr:HAD family phosphatase [Bacteriovorax sp. Seq25_V]EQC46864.1 NLI interacting factor-like phosphatase [Bacteriovorax sp. Seq25_V]